MRKGFLGTLRKYTWPLHILHKQCTQVHKPNKSQAAKAPQTLTGQQAAAINLARKQVLPHWCGSLVPQLAALLMNEDHLQDEGANRDGAMRRVGRLGVGQALDHDGRGRHGHLLPVHMLLVR